MTSKQRSKLCDSYKRFNNTPTPIDRIINKKHTQQLIDQV